MLRLRFPKAAALLGAVLIPSTAALAQALPQWHSTAVDHAAAQIEAVAAPLLDQLPYSGSGDILIYPFETASEEGANEWVLNNWTRWGAGFFPGQLWELSLWSGDSTFADWGALWSAPLEQWKTRNDHDIGFNLLLSAGLGYDRTGDPAYLEILRTGAQTFSEGHWMEPVGSLWSFNFSNERTRFGRVVGGFQKFQNVIIDTSMNIELLFRASREGGDPLWWERGRSHMLNAYRDLVRDDGSTIQVVDYYLEDQYDAVTNELIASAGDVRGTYGWQGYSNETTWSRGQGWAIHGFTTAWRETGDPLLLEAARKVADFWLETVPEDHVPWWDFAALDPVQVPDAFYTLLQEDGQLPEGFDRNLDNTKDSSAAAIAAAGLLELAVISEVPGDYERYFAEAEAILETLSTSGTWLTIDMPYASILAQGTYTFPGSEKGLSWGDYYFVQALSRYRQITDTSLTFNGPDGANQRSAFVEWTPRRWQVRWFAGAPRYGMVSPHLAPEPSGALAEVSVLDVAAPEHFTIEVEIASLMNLQVQSRASAAVVFGYTDPENYWFALLSTTAAEGGVFRVAQGAVTRIATTAAPFFLDHHFHGLRIEKEGPSLQIFGDDNLLLSTYLPSNVTGSVGLGSTGDAAVFSDLHLSAHEQIRAPQEIVAPTLGGRSVYDAPLETAGWTTDAGLPVAVEVVSGPAQIRGGRQVVATGTGQVVLRLTQSGNEYLPAEPVLVEMEFFTGNKTFAAWASEQGLSADPMADANADGVSNLLAFATGSDPKAAGKAFVLTLDKVERSAVAVDTYVSYNRDRSAAVWLRLQVSTNGVDWMDVAPGIVPFFATVEPLAEGGMERVTVKGALTSDATVLFRLVAQMP